MQLSAITSAAAHVSIAQPISLLVARKAMDAAQQQGDAAIALLAQTAEIAQRANHAGIDLRA